MKIISVNKNIKDGKAILSAKIESESYPEAREIFFAYPEEFADHLPVSADPFFPALLIPSMLKGETLEILPELSPKMHKNQSTLQEIFHTWNPEKLSRIGVIANNLSSASGISSRDNATFFSLGVDSMYTMLKYLPANNPPEGQEMNSLIYIKGLELPLSTYEAGQDKDVIKSISSLASHYNLKLITGETNIRDVFPVDFEGLYTGPCLASIALSLSSGIKNIYIPSHYSYAELFPVASSPLTDHMWSNEAINIIHDGSDKDRSEKIADLIVNDPYALDNLRVCVSNQGGNYNCCKCWKCVRTMITMEILDKLDNSKAFPSPLPSVFYKELKTYDHDSMVYARDNLRLARKQGKKDIAQILSNEIRIGKFDQLREGKSLFFLVRELIYYFLVKTGRLLRILKY